MSTPMQRPPNLRWLTITLVAVAWTAGSHPITAAAPTPAASDRPPRIEAAVLAAARAGDALGIEKLITQSFQQRGSLDEASVKAMLNGLARSAELPAFTVLLSEARKTTLGKDWQPDDALLGTLVRDGRKAFIDVMLASWLDPARLEAQRGAGDGAMGEWITRRAAEVRQQRAAQDELVTAAGKGDLDTMRRMLGSGVDVNCVATSRHTPLTFAAVKSQLEAVRLLLERGANVDQPKYPGWDYTPLCLTKSVAIAELLKAHGANVHAKLFKRDVSILTYIAQFGGADMVEWMLRQGLDPKMIGDNQQNLLFDAGDARTAQLLLAAGVDPNHVDASGRTPLTNAQNADIARTLIKAGAKPAGGKDTISTMIYGFAGADAIEEVIKLQGGLDPKEGQNGLISAAHGDQDGIVKVLLAHGAKANKPGKWGGAAGFDMLPLMVCTVHGSPKTAKVLLDYGADPNAGDRPGDLLRNAIQNGYPDVAKILRNAGAQGVSDLAFALAVKDEAKVTELLASTPTYSDNAAFWHEALPAAARLGHLRGVRVALEKGVPLVTKSGDDAIDAAACEGQHEALAILLAHRKQSRHPGDLRPALHDAVWNSHPYPTQRPADAFEKCVKLLLDAGAPIAGRNDGGGVVAAAVFTRYPGGNPKVIEMLVAAGADPNPEHLSDRIHAASDQNGCSTPSARTLATFEKLTKNAVKR